MATADGLAAIVGMPVDCVAVRALVAADGLAETLEPDMEEGEPPRSSLSTPSAGYELACCKGWVIAAFVYAIPAEGYAPFPGPLPGGFSPSSTRQDVLRRFGTPARSGAARLSTVLGRRGAWDRFDDGPVYIHFQYTEPEEHIRLVTLMAADAAP